MRRGKENGLLHSLFSCRMQRDVWFLSFLASFGSICSVPSLRQRRNGSTQFGSLSTCKIEMDSKVLGLFTTSKKDFLDRSPGVEIASLDNKSAREFSNLGTYQISKQVRAEIKSFIFSRYFLMFFSSFIVSSDLTDHQLKVAADLQVLHSQLLRYFKSDGEGFVLCFVLGDRKFEV